MVDVAAWPNLPDIIEKLTKEEPGAAVVNHSIDHVIQTHGRSELDENRPEGWSIRAKATQFLSSKGGEQELAYCSEVVLNIVGHLI